MSRPTDPAPGSRPLANMSARPRTTVTRTRARSCAEPWVHFAGPTSAPPLDADELARLDTWWAVGWADAVRCCSTPSTVTSPTTSAWIGATTQELTLNVLLRARGAAAPRRHAAPRRIRRPPQRGRLASDDPRLVALAVHGAAVTTMASHRRPPRPVHPGRHVRARGARPARRHRGDRPQSRRRR